MLSASDQILFDKVQTFFATYHYHDIYNIPAYIPVSKELQSEFEANGYTIINHKHNVLTQINKPKKDGKSK
jgi:hypothetical protein